MIFAMRSIKCNLIHYDSTSAFDLASETMFEKIGGQITEAFEEAASNFGIIWSVG